MRRGFGPGPGVRPLAPSGHKSGGSNDRHLPEARPQPHLASRGGRRGRASRAALACATRALYVGGEGDLRVRMLGGGVVTFAGVQAGALLPLRVRPSSPPAPPPPPSSGSGRRMSGLALGLSSSRSAAATAPPAGSGMSPLTAPGGPEFLPLPRYSGDPDVNASPEFTVTAELRLRGRGSRSTPRPDASPSTPTGCRAASSSPSPRPAPSRHAAGCASRSPPMPNAPALARRAGARGAAAGRRVSTRSPSIPGAGTGCRRRARLPWLLDGAGVAGAAGRPTCRPRPTRARPSGAGDGDQRGRHAPAVEPRRSR